VHTLLKQVGASETPVMMYSASDNAAGAHFMTRLDLQTGALQQQQLPFRGHDVLRLTPDKVLLFARRPGTQCALVDFANQNSTVWQAAPERHFYGHGCLAADAKTLFTTENDYKGKRGVLGIRELGSFKQMGEYDTYGIGPHDVKLMPDGKTLVVANGGLATHPDFGRRKLNIETMQPSLVYIEIATGKKLAEYRLPDSQLSIRHLVVSAAGDVGVALQFQGNLYQRQPRSLVAWQAAGGDLSLLPMTDAVPTFKGYMADLAFDAEQRILAVSSPRGRQVGFWDTQERRFLYAHGLPEPSGISFLLQQQAFLVSDAQGGVHTLRAQAEHVQQHTLYQKNTQQWDNHLFA